MGRCMCPRNHGGKKVICKKLNLSALSGIFGEREHVKYIMKKKKFFFSFRELFNYFWWLVCRKR